MALKNLRAAVGVGVVVIINVGKEAHLSE